MFDFDPDEWLFFVAAAVVASIGIRSYVRPIYSVPLYGKLDFGRTLLVISPLLGLVVTYVVIQRWSDAVVKGHPDYILMFLVGAAACLTASVWAMSLLGISLREDAIERDNLAASFAVGGGALAVSVIYAFSNVGGGPTIWTTLLPAVVAVIALGMTGLLNQMAGGTVADDITIGRDVASGIRLAGLSLGAALILGRAAGGNWKSWDQTWTDLALYGWPTLPFALFGGLIHRFLRPTPIHPKRSVLSYGLIPALGYLLTGLAIVASTPNGLDPSIW